jgi:hypothetical protein
MKIEKLYESDMTNKCILDADGNTSHVNVSGKGITSLKGSSRIVGGHFFVTNNKLQNLSGAPRRVGGDFDVSDNSKLTSLEGAPSVVIREFKASSTAITNLKGLPKELTTLRITNCKSLIDLSDCPIIHDFLDVSYSKSLKSLKGISYVGRTLMATDCDISSLEDCNISANKIYLNNNPIKSLHNIHKHISSTKSLMFRGCKITECVLGLLLIPKLTEVVFGPAGITTPVDALHDVSTIINKYLKEPMSKQRMIDCQNELIDAGYEEYAQL